MAVNSGHWLRKVPVKSGSVVHQASSTFLKEANEIIINLNREIAKIENMTLDGLIDAANYVYTQTEEGSPVTPVDTGALRASWFIASNEGDVTGKRKFKGPQATTYKKNKKRQMLTTSRPETIAEAKASIGGANLVVVAGYSVPYAAFVHEAIGGGYAIRHWTRSGSGPKWLQRAFNSSKGEILKIIKNRAQIKG